MTDIVERLTTAIEDAGELHMLDHYELFDAEDAIKSVLIDCRFEIARLRAALAQEREECAKVAENWYRTQRDNEMPPFMTGDAIAAIIRARD